MAGRRGTRRLSCGGTPEVRSATIENCTAAALGLPAPSCAAPTPMSTVTAPEAAGVIAAPTRCRSPRPGPRAIVMEKGLATGASASLLIASVGDVASAFTQLRTPRSRSGCQAVVTADRGQPGSQAGLVFIGRSDPVDRFGAVVVCLPTSALPGASRESRSFSCSGPIGLLQRRERRSWRAAPGRTPLVVSRR